MTRFYDIKIAVPLGVRNGTMRLEEQDGRITGTLCAFGKETALNGTREGTRIQLEGTLKTAVREIAYQGEGSEQGEEIRLLLQCGRDTYELTGHLRSDGNCV